MPNGLNAAKNLTEVVPAFAVTNLLFPITYNDVTVFQGASLIKSEVIAAKSSRSNFQEQLSRIAAVLRLKFNIEEGRGNVVAPSITAPQFQVNGVSLRSNNLQPWVAGAPLTTTNNAKVRSMRVNSIELTNPTLSNVLINAGLGLRITMDNGTTLRSYIVRLMQ